MMDENDLRLEYIPMDEASRPKHGVLRCYIDYWWAVHPTRGLIMYHFKPGILQPNGSVIFRSNEEGSVQCNRDKRVTEKVIGKMYPFTEVRQIACVFMPHVCDA